MATAEEVEMLELCEPELDDFKVPEDFPAPAATPPKVETKEAKEPDNILPVLSKDPEVTSLYESLGIDLKDSKAVSLVRFDTLHVHGLDDMSTQDLYKIFEPMKPIALEWIDDSSCNVVWSDEENAAQALLKHTLPLEDNSEPQTASGGEGKKNIPEDTEKSVKDSNEIVMIEEDDDEDEGSEDGELPEKKEEEKKVIWRVAQKTSGNPLKMRFATWDDKKVRGAEKYSEYYKKHGNPNFGGLKGLISSSRKRRFRQNVPLEDVSDDDGADDASSKPDHQNVEDARHRISQIVSEKSEKRDALPKTLKMKMYADEEEKTIQRQKSSKISSRLGSITVNFSMDRDQEDYDELEVSSPQEFGSKSVWDRLQVEVPNTRYSYGEDKKRARTSDHKSNDYHGRRDLRKKLQRIRDDKKDNRSPLLVAASTK